MIFDVIPFCSGYHALLGRTAFARYNEVPHYAYLKLKMPGPCGVIIVNGNKERSLHTQDHTTALVADLSLDGIHFRTLFVGIAHHPLTHVVLGGIAAAAIGLSFQMGLRAARRSIGSPVPALILVATFAGIFLLRLPLLAVVLVMAPISLATTWYRLRGAGLR